VKDPLSLEIWIFRSGQLDHDGNRMIVVAMASLRSNVALFEYILRTQLSFVQYKLSTNSKIPYEL
jgi:hypothetical protein